LIKKSRGSENQFKRCNKGEVALSIITVGAKDINSEIRS
jgi:hypothetical protein